MRFTKFWTNTNGYLFNNLNNTSSESQTLSQTQRLKPQVDFGGLVVTPESGVFTLIEQLLLLLHVLTFTGAPSFSYQGLIVYFKASS